MRYTDLSCIPFPNSVVTSVMSRLITISASMRLNNVGLVRVFIHALVAILLRTMRPLMSSSKKNYLISSNTSLNFIPMITLTS